MSLECPSSPVYNTSARQKLQSKNAAKIYRFGTPKLRDLLREKCRIRVREARQSCYEKSRSLGAVSGPGPNINEILRKELAELEHDIELQEEIYKELVDELNEWFVDQMEQEESYMINAAEGEADELLCPVCQQHALTKLNEVGRPTYECQCEARFDFPGDKDQLRSSLRLKIDHHEQQCDQGLGFFVEQEAERPGVLNGICEKCDFFCSF